MVVLTSEHYPGQGHGHATFFSPSERRVLQLDDRREISMAGPWRATAQVTDLDNGDVVDLGKIGFPANNYWPWVDESTVAVCGQRGRPWVVALEDSQRAPLPQGRWPTNMVGSGTALCLTWPRWRRSPAEHTVFDRNGATVGVVAFARSWCAGFSRDGSMVLEVATSDTEIWLTAWSPATGQPVARQELSSLDARIERSRSVRFDDLPERRYTIVNSGNSRGGNWRVPRVDIEPRSRTFVVELLFPTGEVRTTSGKPCTEVTREWVHLAVDA